MHYTRGVCRICQGEPNFFEFGRVACREVACDAWCSLGGFQGMPPEKIFLNGAIWCVLEYILIKFGLNVPKTFIFYTKLMINYGHVD